LTPPDTPAAGRLRVRFQSFIPANAWSKLAVHEFPRSRQQHHGQSDCERHLVRRDCACSQVLAADSCRLHIATRRDLITPCCPAPSIACPTSDARFAELRSDTRRHTKPPEHADDPVTRIARPIQPDSSAGMASRQCIGDRYGHAAADQSLAFHADLREQLAVGAIRRIPAATRIGRALCHAITDAGIQPRTFDKFVPRNLVNEQNSAGCCNSLRRLDIGCPP